MPSLCVICGKCFLEQKRFQILSGSVMSAQLHLVPKVVNLLRREFGISLRRLIQRFLQNDVYVPLE